MDAVTGATFTSNAIFRAMNEALTAAGADISAFPVVKESENTEKTYETMDVDIAIVGAGGAGMTAAINAAQAGKNVVLLEKMPYVGGNTTKATRVINTKGEAIPGLYAAGEVAGGVHGGNRIGGTAVTDIVVFGRVASESAIAWCDR